MWNASGKGPKSHRAVTRLGRRVAVTFLTLGAQLPAHAQRYVEGDYTGGLNVVIWAIFIVVAVFLWVRNRVRHWWNPQRAEAEDKAAEEKHQAEAKAIDIEMDARMAQIAKADREQQDRDSREWAAAHSLGPKEETPLPGSFAELQKKLREKNGR